MVEESTDTSDTECGCVCNGYPLCNRLQAFAKPQFFLIVLLLHGFINGIVETYFSETVLSSSFSVPYTITRWLILGSEIVQILLVIPIIYCGSERRRPSWLAGCSIFASVCCLIFATQLIVEHSTSKTSTNYRPDTDISLLCQQWNSSLKMGKWKWYWFTLVVLPFLHLAIGISRLAYWGLGITYIDDNSTNNFSPLFIGVAVSLKQFCPFIALFFSSITASTYIAGIYWLVFGIVFIIVAIFTAIFPKKILGSTTHQTGDSGLIPSLQRILSNKTIIFSGLAAIFLQTVVINASSIENRYIESVFYISPSTLFNSLFSIQYLFGILKPTVAAVSLLISGIAIFQIKPRAVFLCIWTIISICITAGAIFVIIFLKCSAAPIHTDGSRTDLVEYCNKECSCSNDIPFNPTCSKFFPYVYYSPCHAGCTTSSFNGKTMIYTNCSCVPTETMETGHCSGGNCRIYWWLFQIFILVANTFLASGFIGNLLICYRSVLPSDKTVMIGIMFGVSSFMAKVPLKLLYDLIANWTCLYYVDGQCRIFNSDKIATFLNLFHICLLLIAAGMLSITCFLVQDLNLYNERSSVAKTDPEPTEMTDFRSQLNQALKTRRESAAEEQRLLSDSSKQIPNLQGHENGNRRASFIEELKLKSSNNEDKITPQRLVLQKPLVPLKPPSPFKHTSSPAVASTPPSSLNNSNAPSPTQSAGTTIRNEGFLTTLL
ncbi:solute carrier organic anion transporter family member 74D-like isoform X2 [Lycorma delicatula]